MSDYLSLELARDNVNAQLAQIKEISLKYLPSPEQNYGMLSHNFVDSAFETHIATLRAKEQRTARELTHLIISEFNCNYNFVCGDRLQYRWYRSAATRAEERMGELHDDVLDAYFSHRNYEKVINLFATPPRLYPNEMGAMINIKSLLWMGRYKECAQKLELVYRRKDPLPPMLQNFYFLQRALCAMHVGQFSEALWLCTMAWDFTVDLAPPGRDAPSEWGRQRPAIAWLRAQINYQLGNYTAALTGLKELRTELKTFSREMWPILSARGEVYLMEYKALIEDKIN